MEQQHERTTPQFERLRPSICNGHNFRSIWFRRNRSVWVDYGTFGRIAPSPTPQLTDPSGENFCFTNVWVIQGQEATATWLGSHPVTQPKNPSVASMLKSGNFTLNSSGQLVMSAKEAAAFNAAHGINIDDAGHQSFSAAMSPDASGATAILGCVGIAGQVAIGVYTGSIVAYAGAAFGVMRGLDNINACANMYMDQMSSQVGMQNQLAAQSNGGWVPDVTEFDNASLSYLQNVNPNPANVNLGEIDIGLNTGPNAGVYSNQSLNAGGSDSYGYGGTGSLFSVQPGLAFQNQGIGVHVNAAPLSGWTFTGNAVMTT